MKRLYAALILTTLFFSKSCFALVIELANCTAASGSLSINVVDNQGIGPIRRSHLSATVHDTSNNALLASYALFRQREGSTSFGRWHYLDARSSGRYFDLAGPSTNMHNITLRLILPSDKGNQLIEDPALVCSVFSSF